MKFHARTSALRHWMFLCVFSFCTFAVIMLPVLLMGYPYVLPEIVLRAKTLTETGVLTSGSVRLVALLIAALHPVIGWQNITGWVAVSVAACALSLLPLWWSIRTLFDARTAWCSTVVMAFLPLFWIDALDVGGYSFAFLFLFLCFAAYAGLEKRHRLLALACSGVCFGLALASRDAFVTFLPWLIFAYLWHGRGRWVRSVAEVVLFLAVAYAAYAAPLLPNALLPGMSPAERAAVFLPSMASSEPGEGHLYPDEYVYRFYRDEYDALIEERAATSTFFERQKDAHYRLIFGVGDANFVESVGNGLWLFLNVLPTFFQQEFVGGAFLWLFIVPGIIVLWKRKKLLLLHILGLWISMEFFIRFILHFGRSHLEDIGWAVALFAGIGIVTVVDALVREWKSKRMLITAFLLLVVVAQLLQANRKLLAVQYSRSPVLEAYAAAEALKEISPDAIVAHPRRRELFFFSPQTPVTLHAPTIDFLSDRGKLAEPFRHYKITHIMGYSPEQTALIRRAMPGISVVEAAPAVSPDAVSPFVQYLLHVLR